MFFLLHYYVRFSFYASGLFEMTNRYGCCYQARARELESCFSHVFY